MSGWIGVDLDGTLAHYEGWKGSNHIGEPVQPMLDRVRQWMADGKQVRVMTARACLSENIDAIRAWLDNLGLHDVGITNAKDFGMITLYDDRCVQVEMNTGRLIGGEK